MNFYTEEDVRSWVVLLITSNSPSPGDNYECAETICSMLWEKNYPCDKEGFCRITCNEMRFFKHKHACAFDLDKLLELQKFCRKD